MGGFTAILLLTIIRIALDFYRTLNPPPGPPPTVGFGKLPKLRLSALEIKGNPTYTLETATGSLPNLSEKAQVAAMKPPQATLLGEEKARTIARALDFGDQGDLSSDKKALIFRDDPDKRVLTVDLTSQNFTLETDLNRIEALGKGKASSGPDALKNAQDLLRRLGLLKFDFEQGNQTTVLRTISSGTIKEASSLSEAQFTEINFFRALTGVAAQSFPILPPNPKIGLIQIWLTKDLSPDILNTLRISYSNWEIDKTRTETYPLRGVSKAWDEVKSGKGISLLAVSGEIRTIAVTSVQLAYFDDPLLQEYLQPIYVFSGVTSNSSGEEGEFTAYAQAVSEEWIK